MKRVLCIALLLCIVLLAGCDGEESIYLENSRAQNQQQQLEELNRM